MRKTPAQVMVATVLPATKQHTSCDLCNHQPPHMCKPCNTELMAGEPLDIFEPHAGRKSIVGKVPADFYFV